MLHYIYALPLSAVILFMAVLTVVWGVLQTKISSKRWSWGNSVLAAVSLAAILYATLSNRGSGTYSLMLNPLAKLEAARLQPELYREMLMNALLFFPLGLTCSHALPRRLSTVARIAITVIAACLLSTGIEWAQYRFSLGQAETSDIICNTLGALIGAASLLLAHALERRKERSLQK